MAPRKSPVAPAAPASPLVKVMLDKERTIEFTNLARYRMGELASPFAIEDLGNKRKSYAALVAWVWASLVEKDAEEFASPAALLKYTPMTRYLELMELFYRAYHAATDDSEKNGHGSTPKPSPSSS